MNLKTLSFVGLFAILVPSFAVAQSYYRYTPHVYIEGQLSFVNLSDASTVPYTGSGSGFTLTNAGLNFSYDEAVAAGLELGFQYTPNVRVGLSVSSMDFEWKSASGSGTLAYGGTSYNLASVNISRSQISGASALDNKTTLQMVNLYFDMNSSNALTPFVGFGIGVADIENATGTETAMSFSVGAQYDLSDQYYVGLKYTRYDVDGPTDGVGFKYNDLQADAITALVGLRF